MTTRKNFESRVAARKEQAVERQEYWSGKSLEDQISALDTRGVTATKQRAKIARAIVKRDTKVVEVPEVSAQRKEAKERGKQPRQKNRHK